MLRSASTLPLYDYSMKAKLWRRANRADEAGRAPIFLRITITKVRAELASGIDVPAAYWQASTQTLVFPSRKDQRVPDLPASRVDELNAQLLELRAAADRHYKSLRQDYNDKRRQHQPTSRDVLESVRGTARPAALPLTVAQAAARYMEAITAPGINKSPATLASYRSRLRNVLEFFEKGQQNKKYLLCDVTLSTARALERWCLAQVDRYHKPRFAHAAMAKQVNMLQILVAWAAIEDHIPANTLHGYKYQSTAIPTLPRFLPAHEVELLAATVFTSTALNDVADMFLFCCYQALSFVDYCRFAADPVAYLFTDEQGREWIRMTRQKMVKRKPGGFSVPFFPEARAIFERRRGRLPIRNGQKVNEFLKVIAQELNLSLPDLIFKDSRSTFAQNWRDAGVSGAVVAAMMGDEERVVNKNYTRVREASITLELAKLMPALFPQS